MRKIFLFILFALVTVTPETGHCNVASAEYVQSIVGALDVPTISASLNEHLDAKDNPHDVTAAQIGLENVPNIDTTNADNLTTGTVNIARLPVGYTQDTVASGADARFDTLPTTAPTAAPQAGRVYVWFE